MELEKCIGIARVLAGAHNGTLKTLGVFGIEDDDNVAPVDGLGNQHRERDALAGLGGAGNACSAFEVHQRPIETSLFRFDAVDVGESDFVIGLRLDLVTQESK